MDLPRWTRHIANYSITAPKRAKIMNADIELFRLKYVFFDVSADFDVFARPVAADFDSHAVRIRREFESKLRRAGIDHLRRKRGDRTRGKDLVVRTIGRVERA